MSDMSAKQAKVEKLIQFLEDVKEHPRGLIRTDELAIVDFLHGIETAYRILEDVNQYYDFYLEVITARGWPHTAFHPTESMKKSGMNINEIVSEVLAIEIEVWKKVRSSFISPPS